MILKLELLSHTLLKLEVFRTILFYVITTLYCSRMISTIAYLNHAMLQNHFLESTLFQDSGFNTIRDFCFNLRCILLFSGTK